jgi:glycosyltransferase involved in cell wall biosynthesis
MREEGRGRPRILVFVAQFLPGEKGGGQVQSVAGLLEALRDEFDFRIVTSDHDLGERDPLPGVEPDVWQERYGGSIFYLSGAKSPVRRIVEILRKGEFDLIYLNSFFSRRFSMLPVSLWWFGLTPRVPLVLAPRGEFGRGALALKRLRKATYLALARRLLLYQDVRWHASSPAEKREIVDLLRCGEVINAAAPIAGKRREARDEDDKGRSVIMVAMDLAKKGIGPISESWPAKKKGTLSIVFLSRVSPMKNLDSALRMLQGLKGEVTFTIFGPLEDARYWSQCEDLTKRLDSNVQVRYGGVIAHADVPGIFHGADLFLFPTHGENFSHVIAEALFVGCPVLTSDQTPWRGLEAERAGWDLPLGEPGRFTIVLQDCIDMEPDDFRKLRLGARERGRQYLMDETVVDQNRSLFRAALESRGWPVDSRP